MCETTVLMTVYNGEKYLAESIKSILNQSYKDFEFLIIDDGSSDQSVDIIRSFDDDRIRLIINKTNMGCVKSLNLGIKEAKGRFVAKVDQDDISYPNRLLMQVEYLNNNRQCVLVGAKNSIISHNKEYKPYKSISDYVYDGKDVNFVIIFGHYTFAHSTFMFRREALLKNNIFYEVENNDDYDITGRLALVGDVCKLDTILVAYRVHDNQLTNRLVKNEAIRIYDEVRLKLIELNGLCDRVYLIKGILRELKTSDDVVRFWEQYDAWYRSNNLNNPELKKELFNVVLKQQKATFGLYCGCLRIKKNFFSKICLIILVKTLLRYNKNHIQAGITYEYD